MLIKIYLFFLIINKFNLLILQQINTAICPLKCICNDGGAFPTQFSSSLQNLSIINSEFENMGIFPKMEKLLVLNLRGNQLKHVGIERKNTREESKEIIQFIFPSLIYLDLSENEITSINEHILRDSPSIEYLDLSNNQLSVAQSSSFFVAQRLKFLNLSHNRLQRFDYDSFSPLFQDLDISNCKHLRLIEQRAFAMTPNLQFLKLANNSQLQYISPYAFENNGINRLVLSNNNLTTIDTKILQQPTRLFISGNPFVCNCVGEMLTNVAQKIVDLNKATCKNIKTAQNLTTILPLKNFIKTSESNKECSNKQLILPFGNYLNATVGEYFSLYCAPMIKNVNSLLYWRLPNGTEVHLDNQVYVKTINDENDKNEILTTTNPLEKNYGVTFHRQRQRNSRPDTSTHPEKNFQGLQHQRERVQVTGEQLRFEVLMLEDAGEYICRVDDIEAKLYLSIYSPPILIKPVEIGSHYIALVWNDSLKIRALERVQLSLQIQDTITGQTGRITQLSLYNPWHSYNVVRLRPLTVRKNINSLNIYRSNSKHLNMFLLALTKLELKH
ncbi:Ig-like domain-containing protein [Meloidogyne graminicola]|uniref:Ig-like domain-containing protein n=1 Tax=Meloidogyne graminicola TaxID=189291 RepID=A0A8S9ZG08_9BILA|nr:Ig-like domain-containing protein [Meloidogyne graminicola]